MIILVLSLAFAAPAPPARPAQPARFAPGRYALAWGEAAFVYRFHADGSCAGMCSSGGAGWLGHYSYDATRRVLRVSESPDGRAWESWEVRLDAGLNGAASYGAGDGAIRVELRRER